MTTLYGSLLLVSSKNTKSLKRFIETIRDYIGCLQAGELSIEFYVYQYHLYIWIGHNYGGCGQGTKALYVKDRLRETAHIVKTFPSFYCEFWVYRRTISSMSKEGVFVGTQNELSNLYISKMRPTIPLHPHTLYEEKHGGYTCTICGYEPGGKEYTWRTCRPCNYGECAMCYAESRRLMKVTSVLSFPSLKSRIDFSTAGKAVDWTVYLERFGEEGGTSKTFEDVVKRINEDYASDWYRSCYEIDIAKDPNWLEVKRVKRINWVTERHNTIEKIKKVLTSSVDLTEYIEQEGKCGLVPPPSAGIPLFVSDD